MDAPPRRVVMAIIIPIRPEYRAARANRQRRMRPKWSERAYEVPANPDGGIEKQIASRAVHFFNHRTDIHQHHHVEADVNQSAVKKHRGHQPVGLAML